MWGCALANTRNIGMPPPAPLLDHLGDTPQRRMDIEDLRNFLMQVFEYLEGDQSDDEQPSNSAVRVLLDGVARQVRQLEQLSERQNRLEAQLRNLENAQRRTIEIKQLSADLDSLRRRIHTLEIS